MKRVFFAVLLMVCVFPAYGTEKIKFFPNGNSNSGNAIELVFNGKIYDEKYTFQYIKSRLDANKASPVESFLYKYVEHNRAGNKDKILSMWDSKYRKDISSMMSDPEMFRNNKAIYENTLTSKMVALVNYGNYVLCIVDHNLRGSGHYQKMYPLVKVSEGKYLMTNDLSDDFFFSRISHYFSEYIYKRYQ